MRKHWVGKPQDLIPIALRSFEISFSAAAAAFATSPLISFEALAGPTHRDCSIVINRHSSGNQYDTPQTKKQQQKPTRNKMIDISNSKSCILDA